MYYCRNCGEPYSTDEAVICVKCGTAKGMGTNYCRQCGKPVPPNAKVCMNCGVANGPQVRPDAKSRVLAGVFGLIFGVLGVHNFYLGYTAKAVTQLTLYLVGLLLCCIYIGVFIVLGVWIWSLIEGIMILTGSIDKDAQGNYLKD